MVDGAITASPEWTLRFASITSAAEASFSRKPLAPAAVRRRRSRPGRRWSARSPSGPVSRACQRPPSRPRRSSSASGHHQHHVSVRRRRHRQRLRAVAGCATARMSSHASIEPWPSPVRTSSWSSTTPPDRQCRTRRARNRRGRQAQPRGVALNVPPTAAIRSRDPAARAPAGNRRHRHRSTAIVGDLDRQLLRLPHQRHSDVRPRPGVLDRVGQPLLREPVDGD